MKTKIIPLFLIIFFIFYFLLKSKTPCKNKEAILYKLENKNYCLLVADSSYKWTKGLMNYKKPVDFDGMIFIFPTKEIQSFWNMNTYLDLDLYWLDDKKVVGKSFLPSIESTKNVNYVVSPKPANKVIELIK
jgi:uncharacterized membrane protein (UPF0127 family)